MLKESLVQVHQRISPFIHRTPVLTSTLLDKQAGAKLYFKCENFQRTGSFKIRGALNAILQLSEDKRKKGVVTHSSGNFAQALSLAAQKLNVAAFVIMPNTAPQVKKDAVKSYGGIVIESEPNLKSREVTAQKAVQEKGATFIHSSNAMEVILGQSTVAKELLEEQPTLEHIVSPVGGGGLIAGTVLAATAFGKNCEVIGGEPNEVDDAYRSLKTGAIQTNTTTNTIADGLKTQLGDLNFPIIQDKVTTIIRVTEDEIIEAMKMIWMYLKIIAEPSSAVALAAVLKEKAKFKNKKIGILISGGNVALENLPF